MSSENSSTRAQDFTHVTVACFASDRLKSQVDIVAVSPVLQGLSDQAVQAMEVIPEILAAFLQIISSSLACFITGHCYWAQIYDTCLLVDTFIAAL